MYLAAFPELHDAVRELLDAERELRRRFNSAPSEVEVGNPRATNEPPAGLVMSTSYDGLRPHARGGLGEVLVADDPGLRRLVAVKMLQSRWAQDPRFRAVQVVADPVPAPSRLVVILDATGVRVEGVDLETVAQLIARLR